jgi:hypothetical protein
MWKEATVAYWVVSLRHLSGATEEDCENLSQNNRCQGEIRNMHLQSCRLRWHGWQLLSVITRYFVTGSTAPLGPGLWFFSFMIILQTIGLLRRMISSSQGLYLNTGQHKHIYITNIYALCGIGTHDSSFRASVESSCLRPLGYCDRPEHAIAQGETAVLTCFLDVPWIGSISACDNQNLSRLVRV